MTGRDDGRDDPELRALLLEPPSATPELDALASQLERELRAADARPLGRMHALPTPIRRALAVAGVVVLALGVVLLTPRPDLGSYPALRMAAVLFALGALMAASLTLALRPMFRPALGRWKVAALCALAVAASVTVALLPPAHGDAAHALPPHGASLFSHAAPCLGLGLLLGLPIYALARVLDRGPRLASILAAAGAGLAGDLLLQLHCPIQSSDHLMAGHVAVVVLFVVGALVIPAMLGGSRQPRA